MKLVFAILTILMIGSACRSDKLEAIDSNKRTTAIKNLVLIPPDSPGMPSYPLMCVKGGDYPNGVEQIFRKKQDDSTLIHAVFPEGLTAPKKSEAEFILKGHFQKIQKRERFVHKKPPQDYQYFVVRSLRKQE